MLSSTGFIRSNLALHESVLTSNACDDHCQGNENCLSWTYDFVDQKCNLKSSAHLSKYTDMTLTSGYKYCPESYPSCFEEGLDVAGYNINNAFAHGISTYDACKTMCVQTTGCTHFIWRIFDQLCVPKSSDVSKLANNGFLLGSKTCPVTRGKMSVMTHTK